MMSKSAKQPLVLAVSLHLLLFIILSFQISSSKQPLNLNQLLTNQIDIIKASAVSQQQLDTRLDAIQQVEQAKLDAQIQRREAIEREQTERKARQLQQQKLEQQQLEQQRQAELAAQAKRAEYVQTELSRYAQLILNAIAAQWVINAEFLDRDLSINFLLSLDTQGNVQQVNLQKSSGYNRLDDAARDAIYSASPLPMSSEADVYSQLASISLTMRPEQVLSPNRMRN